MPKKKQIIADGKQETFKPTSLEQVWGDTGLSKYHTMDEDQYATYLQELNLTDFQAHAATIGLVSIDNRERATKQLIKEFQIHVASYRMPRGPVKTSKGVSSTALRILSEGR